MFKRFFDYYGFSKTEQRGFFVLVALIFTVLIFQVGYEYRHNDHPIEQHILYFSDLSDEGRDAEAVADVPTGTAYRHASSIQTEINYFHFDPNGLPAEKWQELGFSAKQAKAIKNYEANGGKFYRKEDVAKLYVISDEDYARLAPYIVIPHVTRKVEYKEPVTVTPKNSDRKPELLDINLADTTEFKSMRGIGSILAQRTVKYREALGGFHDIGQVAEVYGISPELFENIRPFLRLHSMEITKLNVNSAAVEDLAKHPYISKKQARLIVNYRTQHGAYTDFSDLQKIHALDDDFFRKIAPYIEW